MKSTVVFLVFFCSLLCANISFAQNALLLKNTENNKTRTIKENKRIVIKTIDGNRIKGKFKIENDSTLILNNSSILLDDIAFVKRTRLISGIIGGGLICFGATFCYIGLLLVPITHDVAIFTYCLIRGVPFIATGMSIVPIYSKHKSETWTIETTN